MKTKVLGKIAIKINGVKRLKFTKTYRLHALFKNREWGQLLSHCTLLRIRDPLLLILYLCHNVYFSLFNSCYHNFLSCMVYLLKE